MYKNFKIICVILLLITVINSMLHAIEFERFTFDSKARNAKNADIRKTYTLPYRLATPLSFNKKEKYPLLIFLHGPDENGTDNESQLTWLTPDLVTDSNMSKYPCYVLAPQVPENYKWVNTDHTLRSHSIPFDPSIHMALLLKLINQTVKKYNIDKDRIYITGISMGGFGVYDAITREPELFAAAVPIAGAGDDNQAVYIRHLPIWIFHGDEDGEVGVNRSRNMVTTLEAFGAPNIKYTEYQGTGHDSWIQAYQEPGLLEWIFEQRKQ